MVPSLSHRTLPQPRSRYWPFVFACACAVPLALASTGATAQSIKTDASWGRTAQTLSGPSYAIPQTLGKLAGNNLFHSFETFNIKTGEAAVFSTTTATLQNVISRVSGGSASSINGLLQLKAAAGSAPSFFFINPAGVTFGAGSWVDVPGAFHVSTANQLKFSDGTVFRAGNGPDSSFSIAPPEAFGYLGTTRATIGVVGGGAISSSGAQLQVIAGDVGINGGFVANASGSIRLAAIGAQPAEISLVGNVSSANGEPVLPAGSLTIIGGGVVLTGSTSAVSAGNIEVRSGNLAIDGAGAAGSTGITSLAFSGTGSAGNIDLAVGGAASILNGGRISSSTLSQGKAGTVKLIADTLTIDRQRSAGRTGIASNAESGSAGAAGNVEVVVSGAASIVNGGGIGSSTFSSGNAGTVKVMAGSLTIDGQGSNLLTGISNLAAFGSSGSAGSIEVAVGGAASVVKGAEIGVSTFSSRDSGTVRLSAGSLIVDGQGANPFTGIYNQAAPGGTGSAGNIDATVNGATSILGGAQISTSTFSRGRAGTVKLSTDTLNIDRQGSARRTGIVSNAEFGSAGAAGDVEVAVSRAASIVNGGLISSSTFSSGNAGAIKLTAESLTVDRRGFADVAGIVTQAVAGSSGSAGNIEVTVGDAVSVVNGGFIGSDTFSSGNAGNVKFTAGSLTIDGQGSIGGSRISSAVVAGSGSAGEIEITVSGAASIVNGGAIGSGTYASGNAGTIRLSAGNLTIDRRGSSDITGIFNQAATGSTGSAGNINVVVSGDASIVNGGGIGSDTYSSGNAGLVRLAAGSLSIDGQGSNVFTGISSFAVPGSSGSAGNIELMVGRAASIVNGGQISSSTFSSGKAGTVTLAAGSLTIDRRGSTINTGIFELANLGSTGSAGNIELVVSDAAAIVNGGEINSSTYSSGNAGTVRLTAGSLSIDRRGSINGTGIANQAAAGSSGSAGNIDVAVNGAASIVNGGLISSNTYSSGSAGNVKLSAGTLAIDGGPNTVGTGITAEAAAGSSGQTGGVRAAATEGIVFSNGGGVSIVNGAVVEDPGRVAPTAVSVNAPNIVFRDKGVITASSAGNVAASNILMTFSDRLLLDDSAIGTIAIAGNGGAIRIQGGKLMVLDNSWITTSVLGPSGNGGDIAVKADVLVMNTGFIQANTAALAASGGNVSIDVGALIPSGNTLTLGSRSGHTFAQGVFGYNVIEAAAPDGISGNVQVSSPALDLAGALGGLSTAVIDFGALGKDPCRVGAGSSLTPVGRGGLPPTASGLIRPELKLMEIPARAGEFPHDMRLAQAPLLAQVLVGGGCR